MLVRLGIVAAAVLIGLGGCDGAAKPGMTGSGGARAGSGGATATGGAASGGAAATGGAASGGASATGGAASGGASAIGGAASGGAPATGGAASGGAPATGGAANGGGSATGGSASGGASSGGRGGGSAGGAGGDSATYSGCSYVGGLDRVVVAKHNGLTNVCVVVVFSGGGTNTSQVTLPVGWRVEFAFADYATGAMCARRGPASTMAVNSTAQAGSASWTTGTSWPYGQATVDVTLTFPTSSAVPVATMEVLRMADVNVRNSCP